MRVGRVHKHRGGRAAKPAIERDEFAAHGLSVVRAQRVCDTRDLIIVRIGRCNSVEERPAPVGLTARASRGHLLERCPHVGQRSHHACGALKFTAKASLAQHRGKCEGHNNKRKKRNRERRSTARTAGWECGTNRDQRECEHG
jgi:hypothetical protein